MSVQARFCRPGHSGRTDTIMLSQSFNNAQSVLHAPNPTSRRRTYAGISCTAMLALWWLAATLLQSPDLPGPLQVARFVLRETASGDLLFHMGMTLWRVAAAYVIAIVVGSAIGIAMGHSSRTDQILDPWLIVLLNIPALVVIILAYIWIGLTEAAAILAVAVNKIPNVVVTLREGARALDPGLDEMARAYRMKPLEKLRHVILPQLQPYFSAASRSGLAPIWKIVLVVELLGRSNGVGFQLHLYFQLFDVTGILGYTLVFLVFILLLEVLLVQPIERYTTRWRSKSV